MFGKSKLLQTELAATQGELQILAMFSNRSITTWR